MHRRRRRRRHRGHVRRSTAAARDPSLRISDAEREVAITRLGAHAVEGRLSAEELEHRSDAALTARTHGDLEPLFADLPAANPPRPGRAGHDRYVRAKLTLVAAGGAVWGTVALAQHIG
jgi:Domain of unknown function (DUF1707)